MTKLYDNTMWYEVYDKDGVLLYEGISKDIKKHFGVSSLANVGKDKEVIHVGHVKYNYTLYKGDRIIANGYKEFVSEESGVPLTHITTMTAPSYKKLESKREFRNRMTITVSEDYEVVYL